MKRGGASTGRATAGLVLLHGRGGSADDMLTLGVSLALPAVALLAPEAHGRSWWPTSFLAPLTELGPWLEHGLDAVMRAVAELEGDGLPRHAISVCGFSQGGCLALEFAARHGGDLSAVFGFSAGLIGTADTNGEARDDLYGHRPKRFDYTSDLTKLAVDMSCHEHDPHIPLARFEESAVQLRRLGARVARRIYPGTGHAITRDDVTALRSHLNRGASITEPPNAGA